jgi:hypothetical protein
MAPEIQTPAYRLPMAHAMQCQAMEVARQIHCNPTQHGSIAAGVAHLWVTHRNMLSSADGLSMSHPPLRSPGT